MVVERRSSVPRRRITRSGRRATDPRPDVIKKPVSNEEFVGRLTAMIERIEFQRIAELQFATVAAEQED